LLAWARIIPTSSDLGSQSGDYDHSSTATTIVHTIRNATQNLAAVTYSALLRYKSEFLYLFHPFFHTEYDQPHESQTNKDIVETIHRKGLGEGGGTKQI